MNKYILLENKNGTLTGFFENELACRYDPRASFYGKARIREYEDGSVGLISYDSKVAEISKNGILIYGNDAFLSQTTTRHIREFLRQNGVSSSDSDTKKKLERLEGEFLWN